jgi:DNA-binding SARP family transcriptional activator
MARLNLVLFDGFQATMGARPVVLPLKKAQALLAFLALAPGQRHSRERLAALLWGDATDEQARNSLRQTLFAIRTALGRASSYYVASDPATVWLEPNTVDVDVLTFERFAAGDTDDALARASALYRGDLLDGLAVEAGAFDDWLAPARERLRQAAVTAMTKLLERQTKAGATEKAIATSQKLLGVDPLQEIAHRSLIALYAGAGRRPEAIRQYQTCVDWLQRELQAEPEPATVDAYRALFPHGHAPPAGVDAPSSASPSGTPFIGREAEIAALVRHLRRAAEGIGRVVAVVGEAGVGKTRLTQELIARVQPGKILVLRGRSSESARVLPFALWVDAFQEQAAACLRDLQGLGHAWSRDLEALFPDTARARPRPARGGDRLRLFEALAQLVRWLATARPLLVVLDDVHLADDVSLALLAYLGRRLAAWPILIVATARIEEVAGRAAAALDELTRDGRLERLDLRPLSREDTSALARALLAAGDAASDLAGLLRHVWRVSEGNPFVVAETMRTIDAGHVPTEDGTALPDAVRAMTTRRLSRLSERAQRLVAIAAVIGRELDFALLRRSAGLGELDASEALEELVRADVLRESGDRFEIAHDRIRDVVSSGLLSARRRALHAAVADALEALHHDRLGAHSAELAHHHQAAGNWDKAVTHLRTAGTHAAARGAYREAVGFFEQALAALGRLPRSRATLKLEVDLRIELRDWLMPLGELPRLATYVRDAETFAQALQDDRRLSLTLGHLAHFEWSTGNPRRALDAAERAAAIAARLDDPALHILANFYLGEVHHSLGHHHVAVDHLRRNVALTGGEGVYERYAGPGLVPLQSRYWLAFSLAELGEHREALEIATAAYETARAIQHPYSFAFAAYAVGRLQLMRGMVADALDSLERARELVESREIVQVRPVVNAWLGCAWTVAGRPTDGIPLIQEAVEQAAAVFRVGRVVVSTRLAEALLAAGRLREALRAATEAVALARQHQERGNEASALLALADVYAALDGSSPDTVEQRYAEARDLAGALSMRPVVAGCHRGMGRFLRRIGRSELGNEHLGMAARLFAEIGLEGVPALEDG